MIEKKKRYYSIAGLEVSAEEELIHTIPINGKSRCRIDGLKVFEREKPSKSYPDLTIYGTYHNNAYKQGWAKEFEMRVLHSFEFSDANATCGFYKDSGTTNLNYVLNIERDSKPIAEFIYDTLDNHVICGAFPDSSISVYSSDYNPFLRFGLWFMYGIAASQHSVAAVHSSTIVYKGQAVMFLGESGTGKSTHTKLWRENIEGATLLNDDSPFIGFVDGEPAVYGSPWSGKTPCYKDECYPLRAIVRLSQAPHNKIQRLKGARAIGALLPSLPPAFAYDELLKERMFDILTKVLAKTEVYHLECLPNAEAAIVARTALF